MIYSWTRFLSKNCIVLMSYNLFFTIWISGVQLTETSDSTTITCPRYLGTSEYQTSTLTNYILPVYSMIKFQVRKFVDELSIHWKCLIQGCFFSSWHPTLWWCLRLPKLPAMSVIISFWIMSFRLKQGLNSGQPSKKLLNFEIVKLW